MYPCVHEHIINKVPHARDDRRLLDQHHGVFSNHINSLCLPPSPFWAPFNPYILLIS